MLDAAVVILIRHLASRGRRIKDIAREAGVARNSVRRYLRHALQSGVQSRPTARRLIEKQCDQARTLFLGSARGNAALVRKLLVERGVDISVRTVQRVVRPFRHGTGVHDRLEGFERWELDLVKETAKAIRTTDTDELESDLTLLLARLQPRFRSHAKSWRAFLKTALVHRARNWIRDHQARERRLVSLDDSVFSARDDVRSWEGILESPEPDIDLRLSLASAAKRLPPRLRRLLRLLQETDGNQIEVARRLGAHRNTIGRRIRELQKALRRLGF